MFFNETILAWYQQNQRSLPWRNTTNPYIIWLSEIILQQTRVAQGLPYFYKFINAFPTVHHLAHATEDEVLKLWQGLGYYSRARNMQQTAKWVCSEFEGHFPPSYRELIKLKGIGDYTASAIASICFNEAKAVVDGNVYRVLSRYFGVTLPINTTKGQKYFKELAQKMLHPANVRDYNQGIMEFGALQCVPINPNCNECPLSNSCVALQKKQVSQLPVKIKKGKIKNRYLHYLVGSFLQKGTVVRKRVGKGIWQGLYEFPMVETEQDLTLKPKAAIETFKEIKKMIPYNDAISHKLTHQHLKIRFYKVDFNSVPEGYVVCENLNSLAWPKVLADFVALYTSK